jgi:hypothetical protein
MNYNIWVNLAKITTNVAKYLNNPSVYRLFATFSYKYFDFLDYYTKRLSYG